MDLQQLRYFVRVAEMGSFSRAAAALQVAQPALSRQVQNLERELKERLLIRNGRGVKTTDSGERLLGHARGILRLVERAYEDIENARTGKSGKVAIGMPAAFSASLATPLIRRLLEELPDANVHILHGRSMQMQEWLLTGRLDMAVLFGASSSPMLEVHEVLHEKLYFVSPPGTPTAGSDIPLSEVGMLPLIIYSRPNRIREALDAALGNLGQKPKILFELDAVDTTFDLVSDGVGNTVATQRSLRVNAATRKLVVRKIVEPELELPVQLAMPARRVPNRLHEAAFRILEELCLKQLKG